MRRRVDLLEVIAVMVLGTLGAAVLVVALAGWALGMLALGVVRTGRAVCRGRR